MNVPPPPPPVTPHITGTGGFNNLGEWVPYRQPSPAAPAKGNHFSIIVDAATADDALAAAMAASPRVKATWIATLLSSAVAAAPVRIYGDAILAGERLRGA